jgi:hypothetical protein
MLIAAGLSPSWEAYTKGLPVKKRRVRLDRHVDVIRTRIANLEAPATIAREHGVTTTTIRRVMREGGIVEPQRVCPDLGSWTEGEFEWLDRLVEHYGMAWSKIAMEMSHRGACECMIAYRTRHREGASFGPPPWTQDELDGSRMPSWPSG